MHTKRIIVLPEHWKSEASADIARLNRIQPGYSFIFWTTDETSGKSPHKKILLSLFQNTEACSALFILPKSFASGPLIPFWPDLILQCASGVAVTAVHFADAWKECKTWIDSVMNLSEHSTEKYNATCQYQHPYTDTQRLWVEAGARDLHPGDFLHDDFLLEVKNMQGHWMYWGHADGRKLRGYDHLHAHDLLQNKPASPLMSTVWFSCSTLDHRLKRNIALDWYLSGSAYCMMASINTVNTEANRLLSAAWLKVVQQKKSTSISEIIHFLIMSDPLTYIPVVQHYRLLGWPWVSTSGVSSLATVRN